VYANTLFKPDPAIFNHWHNNNALHWEKLLEPFYDEAAFMMGRTLYSKINPEDRYLRNVAERMHAGDTFQNVYVGVYFNEDRCEADPYFGGEGPLRSPCTECAACMVGCRENAKNTLDKNYLWFAEKFGAKFITGTKVVRISRENGMYRVETRPLRRADTTGVKSHLARKIIVSAGTLGTLNLLFQQKHRYKTLPSLPGSLGENLLTNSETLCAVSGAREKLNNGVAISSVFHPDEATHIEIVKYPDGSNAMKWFFALATGGARHPLLRSLKLIGTSLLHPLKFLKTVFNFRWSTNMVIFLVMQSLENSMKMEWKKGVFGGRMKIKNQGEHKVPAYIEAGQKVMHAYAGESGGIAQNIILEVLFDRPTTAHILGGCPMSGPGGGGVVGENLEVHGHPGMYIIDGSVIQSNPGVNPSFSILAMAEYAMSLIPEKPGNTVVSLRSRMKEN
jgi:cholesterol oxidase